MQILRSTDPLPIRSGLVLLLVGEWGIGKTSLGYSANTLLLDCDEGAARAVNRRDTVVLSAWTETAGLTQALVAPYDAITIDTVEGLLRLMTGAIIRARPRYRLPTGELTPKGWGVLKIWFERFLTTLRRTYGKDVLLLAHAKTVREFDRERTVARIPGGSYHEVMRVAHFVGHLHLVGGRRVLDFNTSDRFIGKNPAGWPALAVPPAAEAREVMRGLFDRGRVALTAAAAASAVVAEGVECWRQATAAWRTVEEFTRGLAILRTQKESDPAIYAQAHHLLSVAARAAGMKYDGAGGFIDLGVRPATVARPTVGASGRPATWQPGLLSELTS